MTHRDPTSTKIGGTPRAKSCFTPAISMLQLFDQDQKLIGLIYPYTESEVTGHFEVLSF